MIKIDIIGRKHKGIVLIDDEDYDLVKDHKWKLLEGKNTYYVINKNRQLMHRLIYEKYNAVENSSYVIDHIDHDGLNNQKYNLRACSHRENSRNISTNTQRGISSFSKYKGVYKSFDKFKSLITVDYVKIYLGIFSNEIDAALAYDNAARKYHGEFACLNFPDVNIDVKPDTEHSYGVSKYFGVSFDKRRKKWSATICYNKKIKLIGRYNTEIEAAKAYNCEAIKLGKTKINKIED
jgi:hypothetical protein